LDDVSPFVGWETKSKAPQGSLHIYLQLHTYSRNAPNLESCEGDAPSTVKRH
jgi:hypothetical protein